MVPNVLPSEGFVDQEQKLLFHLDELMIEMHSETLPNESRRVSSHHVEQTALGRRTHLVLAVRETIHKHIND